MKNKISLTALLLVLCFSCFAQRQRMAVLPTSMNYGDDITLKTLCIDYLREGPGHGEAYNNVLSFDAVDREFIESLGKKHRIEGYYGNSRMKIKDINSKDFLPSQINRPFIVGHKMEDISERYLSFIRDRIEVYRNSTFDDIKHSQLQAEVWQYNVLDILGYIKNDGDIMTDYLNAKNAFFKDFTNNLAYEDEILRLGKGLIQYDEVNFNQKDGYVAAFIRKVEHSNEYVVFRGAQKPMYRGKDEIEIANTIEQSFNRYDNVHLYLENFESNDKEEAFLSTLRIQLKFKNKKLGITKVFKNGITEILNENVTALKLSKPLTKNNITQIKYNSKDYFKTTINFDYKYNDLFLSYNERKIDALANKRSIVEYLIDKTNSIFKNLSTDVSLKWFFNDFKKELKQTMKIENDDEFVMILRNEFENVRIVKIAGNKNIYYTKN